MFDDRICPSCQILLPAGVPICSKCGRTVQPAKTKLWFVDLPQKIYTNLEKQLGPVGAGLLSFGLFLLFLILAVTWKVWKSMPAPQ